MTLPETGTTIEYTKPRNGFLFEAKLALFGHVEVGTIMKEGWSVPSALYVMKCSVHGRVENYIRGGRTIECPQCKTEMMRQIREADDL